MDFQIEHKLIRSNRRTLALIINSDNELIVRAPLFTSTEYINKFIHKHKNWILKKKEKLNSMVSVKKKYIDGEEFLYLGRPYKLKIISTKKNDVTLDEDIKISIRGSGDPKKILTKWYKEQARIVIEELVKKYSKETGIKYSSVKISSAKSRWGSCNSKGGISFTWRLVMAPLDVIEYVVVHELVHIVQRDHSKRFWSKVGYIYPDYKIKRAWLRVHSREFQ